MTSEGWRATSRSERAPWSFGFGFQASVIFLDEGADVVCHVQQPHPLLLVERHWKPAEPVHGDASLFTHLQRDPSRLPGLQSFVLSPQAVQFGLQIVIAHRR